MQQRPKSLVDWHHFQLYLLCWRVVDKKSGKTAKVDGGLLPAVMILTA
jgi:hypothetical protein